MAQIISMPKLGFDMAEGTLVHWVKKVGENINKGEVLAEIETDKATVEVESSASGVVRKLLVDEGTVVPVNHPIAVVGTAEEVIRDELPVVSGPAGESDQGSRGRGEVAAPLRSSVPILEKSPAPGSGAIKASPLAKKIARERGVDLGLIQGSGPGGRIVRQDIESAMIGQQSAAGEMTQASGQRTSSSVDETVNMTKLRQAIARRMAEAKASIPHFYVSHEYKMDALTELRGQFNQIVTEDKKLSVNDFIVKAVALTIRQFPNLNASLNGNSVLRHGQINIGIAVSVEGGLLTIVCREADQKSLRQISAEVKAMAGRVRGGKVKPDDIEGSTFSISNLGMYDVENFAAIINPPEAAILAVSSAHEVPVADEGTFKVRWRMKATISVDHRISDGVEAAKFMQALAVYLEEPLRLLL